MTPRESLREHGDWRDWEVAFWSFARTLEFRCLGEEHSKACSKELADGNDALGDGCVGVIKACFAEAVEAATKALREENERLKAVEEMARSDDGAMGDGYRLLQRAQQAESTNRTLVEALDEASMWVAKHHSSFIHDYESAEARCPDCQLRDRARAALAAVDKR